MNKTVKLVPSSTIPIFDKFLPFSTIVIYMKLCYETRFPKKRFLGVGEQHYYSLCWFCH